MTNASRRTRQGGRQSEAPELRAAIAARLVMLRKLAGLTQKSVAERLDKPKSWVGKLETGRRSLLFSEAIALANLLDVSLDDLAPESHSRAARTRK